MSSFFGARVVAFACVLLSLLAVACPASAAIDPAVFVRTPSSTEAVARLRAVLARGGATRSTFVKVGDSNTATPSFLRCFAGADVRLGDHAALEETRAFFGAQKVDALHASFARVSEAATAGWLTQQVLAGATPHLDVEIAKVKPAFAVVMLGTNDNRVGGQEIFVAKIAAVVDRALAAGVVPILSTVPPRDDGPAAAARVAALNQTIEALAASRGLPLVDLHAALADLPRHGLSADGVHLAPAGSNGTPHPCWFTERALEKGMNVRNLLTLVALDQARRTLL
jgi:lysophospholipase L1-like esterase